MEKVGRAFRYNGSEYFVYGNSKEELDQAERELRSQLEARASCRTEEEKVRLQIHELEEECVRQCDIYDKAIAKVEAALEDATPEQQAVFRWRALALRESKEAYIAECNATLEKLRSAQW